MTLPTIDLQGTAYEQGHQHGTALREDVGHNLDVYFDRFWREGHVTREQVLQRARRYAPAMAEYNRDYEAAMQGIADGAGVSFQEIVALNVRYEILYYQHVQSQLAAGRDGCTSFAVAPAASANGHLLMGQNWDWIPDVRGALIRTTHEDGLKTLAFTEAGIHGGKIGLNSAGLGLAINGLSTTGDDWGRLVRPFHLRCYEILRQGKLEDAVRVVTGQARACSGNFLVAQTPDRAVNLEAAPDVANSIGWQDGCIVHTNHFLDANDLGIEEPPNEFRPFSCLRQDRLQTLLKESRPITIAAIQSHLKDHSNAPRSICRHEDRNAPIDERYSTMTSIVIDLELRQMSASDGPPCSNPYQMASLSD